MIEKIRLRVKQLSTTHFKPRVQKHLLTCSRFNAWFELSYLHYIKCKNTCVVLNEHMAEIPHHITKPRDSQVRIVRMCVWCREILNALNCVCLICECLR